MSTTDIAAVRPGAGLTNGAPVPPPRSAPAEAPKERMRRGKLLRRIVPLEAHAELPLLPAQRDPVGLLEQQSASRVPELVPIRYGRMSVSPWTFYRGAARVMAEDLVATPRTGVDVQLCGDAHLANFGLFGSPERQLVFDINDFDETYPGPWEWDVKRLAASIALIARERGLRRGERVTLTRAALASYRLAMRELAGMREIDVWYSHAEIGQIQSQLAGQLDAKMSRRLEKGIATARTRDSMQALAKLAGTTDGALRIIADPPLVVPLRDLLPAAEGADFAQWFQVLIRQYRQTLQPDRRVLFSRYRFVDMARKVVGVGSVGTRCWIVLMAGRDESDPLFIQIKEAGGSVITEALGKAQRGNEGQRVVNGQRLMQAASDIFLGWQRAEGFDGVQRDFYVRQLRDWKFSLPLETIRPQGLHLYADLCARCLARAHARSGDRFQIAGYLGSSSAFDNALTAFAEAYADRTENDHEALLRAIRSERVQAVTGV